MEGVKVICLPALIELKLASGMTNLGRLKDLADVQELIKVLKLPREFSEKLDAYVRGKFEELWTAVANNPADLCIDEINIIELFGGAAVQCSPD